MALGDVSQELNKRVLIATMVVSVVFVLARCSARWYKIKGLPFQAEDLAMYTALGAFITQCSLYLAAMPTLYNALAIQAGKMEPYASLPTDLGMMLREFMAVLIFFWLTLWSVKISLLFLFRQLTFGLPMYERLWWFIIGFVGVTFFGCVLSDFFSCHSFHAWFHAGECYTHKDAVAKSVSLWYALSADLLTDMMIMAIPLKLLWNLRISIQEKIAVCFVFTVSIITMVFAIVRSVSLDKTTNGGQVSTQWLILWGAIEGMVAIIVGCLPAFAIFIKGHVAAARLSSQEPLGPYATPSNESSMRSERRSHRLTHLSTAGMTEFEPNDTSMHSEGKRPMTRKSREEQIRCSKRYTQTSEPADSSPGPQDTAPSPEPQTVYDQEEVYHFRV